MGARGQLPQIFSIRSQLGKHPATMADVPSDQLGKAVCPRWLTAEARKFWKEQAPDLESRGLLTGLDEVAFTMLCTLWSDIRDYQKRLAKDGPTLKGKRGAVRAHPVARMLSQAEAQFHSLAREFGLTPASRGRLRLPARTGPGQSSLAAQARQRASASDPQPLAAKKDNHESTLATKE
jgi:P27 family predicted phage terminase small subunit